MRRARLRVWLDRLLEPLGYRRVAFCSHCDRWFPIEGPGNFFQHMLAGVSEVSPEGYTRSGDAEWGDRTIRGTDV